MSCSPSLGFACQSVKDCVNASAQARLQTQMMKLSLAMVLTAQCAVALTLPRRKFLGAGGAGAALSLPLQSQAAGRPKVVVVGGYSEFGFDDQEQIMARSQPEIGWKRRFEQQ